MAETKIEWTERTWNPIVGCTIHSPGCKNCYAMRMAARLEAMAVKPDGNGNPALNHYVGTTESSRRGAVWTGNIGIAPDDSFTAPLRRKRPTDYFVNSMSDLFHKDVPFEVVDRVFAVMALTPQHTYKILTKRSDRMREYMNGLWQPRLFPHLERWQVRPAGYGVMLETKNGVLPNVWLGVSVEDQSRADERIPDLLDTPAAIRFISAEPLLGPVDLAKVPWHVAGYRMEGALPDPTEHDDFRFWHHEVQGIRWVIAGGESGPDARPMHPAWARSLRDQCAAAGVAFHFKQWGEWAPSENCTLDCTADALVFDATAGTWRKSVDGGWIGDQAMCRVGKKRAGRLLDGIEHNSFPSIGEGR